MGIAVANLAVRSMDVEFYSIALGGRARLLDRFTLRLGNPGNTFRALPPPSPLITMRDYMNWFCHFVLVPYVRSPCLTPFQPTGILCAQITTKSSEWCLSSESTVWSESRHGIPLPVFRFGYSTYPLPER